MTTRTMLHSVAAMNTIRTAGSPGSRRHGLVLEPSDFAQRMGAEALQLEPELRTRGALPRSLLARCGGRGGVARTSGGVAEVGATLIRLWSRASFLTPRRRAPSAA